MRVGPKGPTRIVMEMLRVWFHSQGYKRILPKALKFIVWQKVGRVGNNGTDLESVLFIVVQHNKSGRTSCFEQFSAFAAIAIFVEAVVLVVEGNSTAHTTVTIALCGAKRNVIKISGFLRCVWTGYA